MIEKKGLTQIITPDLVGRWNQPQEEVEEAQWRRKLEARRSGLCLILRRHYHRATSKLHNSDPDGNHANRRGELPEADNLKVVRFGLVQDKVNIILAVPKRTIHTLQLPDTHTSRHTIEKNEIWPQVCDPEAC